jgi:type II secretory pathway component GspD/PulD (secretin)
MHIIPEQSAQTGTFSVDEIPVVETRNVETTLRVRDGQTIIIGGLRKVHHSVEEDKIPILGDIPIIGALFRKVNTGKVESEIGVFITPHIYTDGELSAEELELLHSTDEDKSLFKMSDLLRFLEDD